MRAPPKLIYLYLGRRGAMPKFALDLARADGDAPIAIAHDNELAGDYDALPNPVAKLRLFSNAAGGVWRLDRLAALRRELLEFIAIVRPDAVVELMPHVWSPLLEDLPRRLGVRRVALLHDWRAHPGDYSGLINGWLTASALRADHVVTLSAFVAQAINKSRPALQERVSALFHPDFEYQRTPIKQDGPLRVLFFGRLLAYKGLDLCIDAIERARTNGVPIEFHVAGAGDISALRPALQRINATVDNHWLADSHIQRLISECDVVAATHREASQSGAIAAAFGAGRPVVATPVGALAEQVAHERTGLVTDDVSVDAIARAFTRLATDRNQLSVLASNVNAGAPMRSMAAFARALTAAIGN